MKPASLSLRLGLQVGLLGAGLVLLLAVLGYWSVARGLESIARSDLQGRLERIAHSLGMPPHHENRQLEQHHLVDELMGHDNLHLRIISLPPRPSVLFDYGFALPAGLHAGLRRPFLQFEHWRDHHGHILLIASRQMTLHDGTPVSVQLAYNRLADEQLLQALLHSILLALPFLLFLTGGGAWWTARRSLQPLHEFMAVAARVSTESLTHRIETRNLPRELHELACGINVMLERLDLGVQQLTRFSDDLAHELRSPITNLLGRAQVTLARERSAAEYRVALESCSEELERLARIVSDMLYLAQVSEETSSQAFGPVELEAEMLKMADIFSLAAEDKNIRLTTAGAGQVTGDRLMIQRALSNLLSNAIRYCPRQGQIHLEISPAPDQVSLSVTNSGPGIAVAHQARIFERFYRVDPCRSRGRGGTGLGLAIVQSIMQRHGGRVDVCSSPEGPTCFSLIFPVPAG